MATNVITHSTLSGIVVLTTGGTCKKLMLVPANSLLPRGVLAVEGAGESARRLPVLVGARTHEGKAKKKTGADDKVQAAAEDGILSFVESQAKEALELASKLKIPRRLQEEQANFIGDLINLLAVGGMKGDKEKVFHVLMFIRAAYGMAKLCLAAPSRSAGPSPPPPPPPAPDRKRPKVFFRDGSAMTFDFGPGSTDEAKMLEAVKEAMSHARAAMVFVTRPCPA